MTQYQWSFFNNRTTSTPDDRPATQEQKTDYIMLCREKGLTPKNYTNMNFQQLEELIREARQWRPISPRQKELIIEICERIGQTPPTEKFLNGLSGGQMGTGAQLIARLMETERQLAGEIPPTEDQVRFILDMFVCPDVDFTELGLQYRIPLEGTTKDIFGEEKAMWRRPTAEEVANFLLENISKADASEFIQKYRSVYFEWRTTRVTDAQVNFIRELENRLANIISPKPITEAMTIDGEVFTINVGKVGDKAKDYAPVAYRPIDEIELRQLSRDDAKTLIDRLQAEIRNPSLIRFPKPEDATFESIREAKTLKDEAILQSERLINVLHKLLAVAGHDDDQLINSAMEMFDLDLDKGIVAQKRKYIKDFMDYLLENKFIGLDGLVEICKESAVATKILESK